MFCPSCGKQVDNNVEFCPECGYRVKGVSPSEIKSQAKGFFSTLFDWSFTDFITLKIVKFIFIIGLVIIGLATIAIVFSSFQGGTTSGLLMLILSPVFFFFMVLIHRIYCEILIVIFKVADYLREIKNKLQ
ncbi:DUF4282 domain-containing protein [Thermodesulfovibrio sp.]|jgi:endogenous inhibitor of DNA gyrase (YacG/DUF329 family)|uniref:DUF4282 domain-containing protein n=1 Tax=Thermodesulfovibrio TaxID=28261 RepID=UPI002628FB80|nr:DUF4282 domain-containing protein [Thermodesulfovibrio sp.]